jgi:SOS-response transcriptional repressor LexA
MEELKVKTKTTGFGSPAENYVQNRLDLNKLIPKDIITTYYFKYEGVSKYGVNEGDILVTDKSVEPSSGDLVLLKGDNIILEKFNSQTNIWGVVTWILTQIKK